MNKQTIIKAGALVFLLTIICSSALTLFLVYTMPLENSSDTQQHQPDLTKLSVGDLVFRMGTVTDSKVIAYASDSRYSHIGVVVETTPQIMVVHATTSDHEETPDQVLYSPISDFWSYEQAQAGAAARISFLSDDEKQQLAQALKTHIGEKFLLDTRENPHLYCSTLIYDELVKIHPEFSLEWKKIELPVVRGEYLFPQNFLDDKAIIMTDEFTFTKK